MGFYLFATCASYFLSSHRMVNLFGIVLLVLFLISVWFFFLAILSLIIYLYFKLKNNQPPHNKRSISTIDRMGYPLQN